MLNYNWVVTKKILIKTFETVLLIKHMLNSKLYFANEAHLNYYVPMVQHANLSSPKPSKLQKMRMLNLKT